MKKQTKKPTQLRRLTIDRSRWGKGSLLVREGPDAGKMCCLGFVGEACGIDRSRMLGGGLLWQDRDIQARGLNWLYETDGTGNDFQGTLAHINDSNRPRHVRERMIAKIFADHGVKVTFVDGPKKAPTGRKKTIGSKRS